MEAYYLDHTFLNDDLRLHNALKRADQDRQIQMSLDEAMEDHSTGSQTSNGRSQLVINKGIIAVFALLLLVASTGFATGYVG